MHPTRSNKQTRVPIEIAGLGHGVEVRFGVEEHPQAASHDLVIVGEDNLAGALSLSHAADPTCRQSVRTTENGRVRRPDGACAHQPVASSS
jgi:hypothetical protein